MRNIIWVIIIIELFLFSCNIKNERENEKLIGEKGQADSFSIKDNGKQLVLELINPYLDSSKDIRECGSLPNFLFDKNFDLQDTIIMNWYAHNGLNPRFYSLRVEYFKNVKNLNLLNCIASLDSEVFSLERLKRNKVPSDSFDNYKLAGIRLWELKNNRDSLSKLDMTPADWNNFEEFNIKIDNNINTETHIFDPEKYKKPSK